MKKANYTQMQAVKYLNEVMTNAAALVPLHLVNAVCAAAAAIGLCVCGGALDADNRAKYIYIS